MTRPAAALVILLFAGSAFADLQIVNAQPSNKSLMVLAAGGSDAGAAGLIWEVYPPTGVERSEAANTLTFTGPAGTYTVTLRAVLWDQRKIITATQAVTIGTPPGPTPPPVPPIPPAPSPAPIPADGFRVLIVYETADLSRLPPSQIAVLYGDSVRNYLNAKCVKGPDGKTAEWRVWDANVPTGAESKLWQDAMARPRKSLPWVIVSDGKAGYEGPLPPTVDETMALLKKYGGP